MKARAALALAPVLVALIVSAGARAAGPPTIEATWVESVTATSANLRAEIDPNGSPSHYRFEYLTEAAYRANGETFAGAARVPAGAEAPVPGAGVAVYQHLERLTPTTVYYFRVVATNAALETTAGPARFLATEEPTNVHPPLDGRGWEMVSPVDKSGGAIAAPGALFGGGDIQAAASSAAPALTYGSSTAFGAATGAPPASQYISRRGAGGWSTQNVSAPLQSGGYGDEPDGVPYRVFSEDLGRALMLNPRRCESEPCPRSYSLRDNATGAFTPLPAAAAGMRVFDASPDLSHIFFEEEGGAVYEWSGGGGLTPASPPPPDTGTERVSADGLHRLFLTDAEIPPFDNIDANTGEPDTEVYLEGPPPGGGPSRLVCVSCNPTGERPHGSATIPGAEVNGSTAVYKPRVLSTSGNRVFFDSSDRLVTADTDGAPDVYEWEAAGEGDCMRQPGCVGLISGGGHGTGGHATGASFLDASADGTDAYFLTEESLVGTDPGSIDAYDYRIGGGFPEPEPPFVCKGDACQALPNAPEDPTPGTLVKNEGNPKQKYYAERQRCPKGTVRRWVKIKSKKGKKGKAKFRFRCVKRHKHKRHRGHKHRHGKRAGRRAGR